MILVFGGNGQLGQELMRAAASRGCALCALTHAEADIADIAAVAAAFARCKPNIVVNAAAYTKVDLAESAIVDARLGNETGPAVLAEACARAGLPLLHVSTDYVFDGSKDGAYLETDLPCPINVYGRSKAAGEEAIRRTLAHHFILRTAWVYSEFGNNFLKTILRLAATRDEIRVVADQYGSPTSARDIAEAILQISPSVARDRSLSGTYHFTADGVTTWHGFASRIVNAAASITARLPNVTPILTAEYPTPAKRPTNSQLDCRLFVRTFRLTPHHWTEAVDATTRALANFQHRAESHVT